MALSERVPDSGPLSFLDGPARKQKYPAIFKSRRTERYMRQTGSKNAKGESLTWYSMRNGYLIEEGELLRWLDGCVVPNKN
jgi:hypothetical protein